MSSGNNIVWNGALTAVDNNIYQSATRGFDNSLTFILEIVHKFDVPFSIKKHEEGTPGTMQYFNGSMLTFGTVEYKVYGGHGFNTHDREQILLKLSAMYPEKILNPEEMKKRFYKDTLKEEK